ncbi:MAG: Maf family nucleotide pyrophosphatase [bacterium]
MPTNSQCSRFPLILASASERRRKILESLGVSFEVVIPDVEELTFLDDARRTASENAIRKSRWSRGRCADRITIAADTVIDFKGRVVCKPVDMDEAFRILRQFSGTQHTVITAVAWSMPDLPTDLVVCESQVVFKVLADEQILEYCRRVNPLDKAGAYDIDQHGEMIIESFSGSITNIMGLPGEVVEQWLKKSGVFSVTHA